MTQKPFSKTYNFRFQVNTHYNALSSPYNAFKFTKIATNKPKGQHSMKDDNTLVLVFPSPILVLLVVAANLLKIVFELSQSISYFILQRAASSSNLI